MIGRSVLLRKHQSGRHTSNVEEGRDVAGCLTYRPVRCSITALVDALDSKKCNICGEDNGSLWGIESPYLINSARRHFVKRRTGMVYTAQSVWSPWMKLRHES